MLMMLATGAQAQILTNAQAVKIVIPYNVVQTGNVSISNSAAVELTGNTSVGNTTKGYSGVAVLNWSTTQDIYCCFNNSACSTSSGANQGWPILRQPSGSNFNWQFFNIPTWETFYCIATAGGVTANVLLYR